ncbi:alpha-ketoglutarate-dependent dioxygenase AlkB [Pseudoalteromonas sp. S16_S37]|uniref:alpha-ketoglutarate-dependent dioxygenase AlkB n=1 Tax=Pseudoalteromonas sp. S16_S37 TaxID=2720228 RepID=UPI0016808871|nr:alpha-ketoglutarate-dependent dioxygenase AlkB [Pseudoalteromonas sp. S16_S37]
MKLPLTCNAYYDSNFMSDELSTSLFNWLMSEFDLSKPEELEFPDGTRGTILPWRMMFLEPNLASSKQFPLHHGRRAATCSELEQLRQQIAQSTGVNLEVAVCLYYPNGEQSLGFHCDLPAFGSTDVIASISLGAPREFLIRANNDHNEQHSLILEHGSLLVMGKGFQDTYQHALAHGTADTGPRFNISFRQFGHAHAAVA